MSAKVEADKLVKERWQLDMGGGRPRGFSGYAVVSLKHESSHVRCFSCISLEESESFNERVKSLKVGWKDAKNEQWCFNSLNFQNLQSVMIVLK